ncbi:MAG: LysE family transporter [bacterium]|nr:LysE family transporter [bacterium]
MIEYILISSSFAFAASVQPGPLQAFLLARVAEGGWKQTLPASLAPLISDGPIAALVMVILFQVPGNFERVLRAGGGIVLIWFALRAFAQWRRSLDDTKSNVGSAPRTLIQAVFVNLINPGPYLGWSLVLGPLVIEAWAKAPMYAIALVGAFYAVLVLSLAVFILLVGTTSFLGPRGRRALVLVSAVALAILGIYQLGGSFKVL